MVYESVGMHASLLGFCLESLVLGDDILGQVLRTVRGIDVTPDSVSIDAMKEVCLGGPGHYLGSDQTRALMQTEYVYPAIGNRMSPKEWVEADRPILIEKAIERKNQILASSGNMFDPDIDAAIRKNYNIYFNSVRIQLQIAAACLSSKNSDSLAYLLLLPFTSFQKLWLSFFLTSVQTIPISPSSFV